VRRVKLMGKPAALIVAVSAPGVVVAGLYAVLVLAGASGREWLWPPATLSLSEAVVAGDAGEIARQIAMGVDPNQPANLRRGFLGPNRAVAKPLEVAIARRRPDLGLLLLRYGARADDAVLQALRCLAQQLRDTRTRAMLDRYSPVPLECSGATNPPS
jgi:hypothetical protein